MSGPSGGGLGSPSLSSSSSPPVPSSSSASAAAASGDGAPPAHDSVGSDGLTSKEREQLNLQSSAFDALERDFREVLNELVGDKSLERFRLEYEKLHHTLKKSHENEVSARRGIRGHSVARAVVLARACRIIVHAPTMLVSRSI
jgi:hypothetical protein